MPPTTEALDSSGPGQSSNGGIVPELATNGAGPQQLHELLAALQAMRVGDFSVRLPGDRLGIEGKIADTFNEIVAANQRMAAAARAGRPGRRPRRQDPAAREVRHLQRRLGRDGKLGQHADRRSALADHAK